MLAPTVGAILACVFGPGLIRFGMPSWWLLASFLPAVLVLIAMVAAARLIGERVADNRVDLPWTVRILLADQPQAALYPMWSCSIAIKWGRCGMAVPQSLLGCISALREEIGWRGFLWPLMRRRLTFVASAVIMFGACWIYHAGLIFAGWYGFKVESRHSRWACSVSCCSSTCRPSGQGRSGRACRPTAPGTGLPRRTSPHWSAPRFPDS
jgi:hypothetical protein